MKVYKMKKATMSFLMIFAMIFATASAATAQGRQMPTQTPKAKMYRQYGMFNKIPDLTDTQKEQIKKLRIAMMKEIQPLQNQLGEKRARLRTLSTAEKADMKAINKLIDEMAVLRASIMKTRMKFVQDVRALLTEEQRVVFDRHFGMHKAGKTHAHKMRYHK